MLVEYALFMSEMYASSAMLPIAFRSTSTSIGVIPIAHSPPRAITRFPQGSTRIRSPGNTMTVVSSCSTIAGPWTVWSGARSLRR